MSDDDGIDFQWGDRYIKQQEHVPGLGNKYVRFNKDGSVTEFKPPEYLLKNAMREFEDICVAIIEETKSTKTIGVKDRKLAEEKVNEFNNDEWWLRRRMRAEISGDRVTLIAHDKTLESTYFPGGAEDDGIDFQWGDRYIKESEENEAGGKYWMKNDDGTITKFIPPQLRCRNLIDDLMQEFIFHVIDDYHLEFYDEKTAREVEYIIMSGNDNTFACELNGLIMEIITSKEVFKSTHPAKETDEW